MKNFKITISLLVLLLVQVVSGQSVKLKIIETSDLHGAIFPYDFINDKPAKASVAQISSYVKSERSKTDQEVILLDAGDLLQGQPPVYYYSHC